MSARCGCGAAIAFGPWHLSDCDRWRRTGSLPANEYVAASRREQGDFSNREWEAIFNEFAPEAAQSPQVGAARAGESEGLGLPPPPRRGGEWWHADRLAHWECPTCRAGYDAGAGLVCEGDQGKCHPAASTKAHGTPAEPCEEARCLRCGWAGTIPAETGRSVSDRPPVNPPVASADPELPTPDVLDELERLLATSTPGVWKLWAADVMADQDGTSNVETAKHVASTHFTNSDGRPRTNDAQLICALQRNARGLIAAARSALSRLAGQSATANENASQGAARGLPEEPPGMAFECLLDSGDTEET